MAIIGMTVQEARGYVKKNDAKLQVMYDTAPFADEDQNSDVKSVVRGFEGFREYNCSKKKGCLFHDAW